MPADSSDPQRAFPRCAAATTVLEACEGLVDDLVAQWSLPSVYLLVDGRIRCQAARGYFQVVDGFPPGTGVIGRTVRAGVAEVIPDVLQDPSFIAAIPGLRAEVCVPVRVHGQVVGAVNVESMNTLPADASAVLSAAAGVLGARIEAAGGLPEASLSQRLARIAVSITELTDAADIEARVVDAALDVSGLSSAALYLRDADGGWSVARTVGPLAPALAGWTDADFKTLAGWVAAGTSSHFRGDPDLVPAGYEFLLGVGIRAFMVHPLVVADRVTGLLATAHTEPVPHDAATGAAVELLAAQAAASLGVAAAIDDLSLRARQDPLTRLPNSAAFTEDLDAAVRGAATTPAAETVCLLIDVDHFKQVNDTYGHLAGDRLLRALADELSAGLRADDAMYRIGGDEFAALLRVTDAVAAREVAERLLRAARRVRATISIGVCAVVAGVTAEQTRDRADRALYHAKSAGRDRVEEDPGP